MKTSQLGKVLLFIITVGLTVVILMGGCVKTATTTPKQTATTTPTATVPIPTATTTPKQTVTTMTSTPTNQEAAPYGELKIAVSEFGEERFDTRYSFSGSYVYPFVYDGLLFYGQNGLEPRLAESWEIAPDGLSWTLHLRKDVYFHNGDRMTANDVKFSLQAYMSDVVRYQHLKWYIDRIDVVEDYTVRIYTKGPQPYLWTCLTAAQIPTYGIILPMNYIQKNGWDYFEQHPIGTGPYKFVSHKSGDLVKLEMYDKYWGPRVHYQTVTVYCVPDESTRISMLKVGEVDATNLVNVDQYQQLTTLGFNTGVTNYGTLIFLNLWGTQQPEGKNYPTANLKVRQALSEAINRSEIISTLYRGNAKFPIGPGLLDTMPATEIDVSYWKDYAAKAYRYDPVAAKQLLADAGYPNGFEIKLYCLQAGNIPNTLPDIIQGYWQKIGVKAQIIPIQGPRYMEVIMTKGNPDLVGQVTLAVAGFPNAATRNLSDLFTSTGLFHLLSNSRPDLDTLISNASSEMNADKRKQMIAQAEQAYFDYMVALELCFGGTMSAVGPKVDAHFTQWDGNIYRTLLFANHK